MRIVSRSLMVWVLGCLLGSCWLSAAASAEEVSSGAGSSPLLSSLVIAGSPEEAQELHDDREAKLDNPEAVAAREQSRTAYAHLATAQVAALLREAFPAVVEQTVGGAPEVPKGSRVLSDLSTNAAQVLLPDGQSGIVESLQPLAKQGSPGHFSPINLALTPSGGGYVPSSSDVDVRIPRELSAGVQTPEDGVSLTPVDSQGQPLMGSQGMLDGVSVLYTNTGQASDTIVKPTVTGFQMDSLLRSVESPEQLYFKVGMAAGATLVGDPTMGTASVVLAGSTLATILAPTAEDAAGTSVPVSMTASGDTLAVTVDHRSGSYLYPVEVDPSIIDSQLTASGAKPANWEFKTEPSGAKFGHTRAACEGPGEQYLETCATGEYKGAEVADWLYQTRGNSKIYELKGETEAKNTGAKIESFVAFKTSGGVTEGKDLLLSTEVEKTTEYSKKPFPEALCPKGKETCVSTAGSEKNAVVFQQSTTSTGSKFKDYLYAGEVSISEPEEHATAGYNTTSPELEGEVENTEGKKEKIKRTNVLDGGGWLSKYDGSLEFTSEDKGIGVSATRLEYENAPDKWEQLVEHKYLEKEDLCKGVQCEAKQREFWVLEPKLPNGEDKIRYRAEDAMPGTESPESEGVKVIKVDTAKPHSVVIKDLPPGNELSERAYNLTVEAADGEGSTIASSGIKSIALYIDKGLIGTNGGTGGKEGTEGKCSVAEGECTARAKWTLKGAELGAGRHEIEVVAFDNAGNEKTHYEPVSIRHSTPVTLGPGSVDLQSGDFSLGATDVSMGSGLTVSRNYSSRATEQGYEGPFGPEWSLNLGNVESLAELVDGSMLLTDGKDGQTVFAKTNTTTYESPIGDSNLKLNVEENKENKQKLAYYLEDTTTHTETKFTSPSGGTNAWVPTRQEGTVSSDTMTYAYRTAEQYNIYHLPCCSNPGYAGIVSGSDGSLWFSEWGTKKIGKITTTGVVTEYAVPLEHTPSYITAGQDGDLWFIWTNEKNSKQHGIDKVTTSGQFTEYTLPENSDEVTDITSGPGGEQALWFTITGSTAAEERIDRITTSGQITAEYPLPEPEDERTRRLGRIVAGPDGNLWYTVGSSEAGREKIVKMTTSGVATVYKLPPLNNSVRGLAVGADGENALWVTEDWKSVGEENGEHTSIAKITTSGTISEYALSNTRELEAITAGPEGNMWFTHHSGETAIGKITPSGVITEYPHVGESPRSITLGPDGNLWYANEANGGSIGVITPAGVTTEPTEVLAPVPDKVSCTPMKEGCRALKFEYATGTTASGENESEWGEYKGRLMKVLLDAYNPVTKKMEEPAVAEYRYDKLGRLRAAWDPRVSPELKTTYGYDVEGHVTALNPPGQESWVFTYGAIAGDSGTGRLLKAMQAPASSELWGGKTPENTEVPKITGSTVVGIRLAVSNGKWSGSPVSYGYQWEDCNSAGGECTPIKGAINPNYTPATGDVGHTLAVQVTATNGGGSVTMTSIASSIVYAAQLSEYSTASGSGPFWITTGSDKNLWFTDWASSKIGKITTTGTVTEYALPAGSEPRWITSGADGNLWFADIGTSKIGKITTAGIITEYALPVGSQPLGITSGPDGNLWFTDSGTNKIGKITTTGTVTEYSLPAGSTPYGITSGPDGNLWFAALGTSKIGKITTAGIVTEYALPSGSGPYEIVTGPDKNLWFSDYMTSRIGKITTSGIVTEYSLPSGSGPRGIVSGPEESLWFVDLSTSRAGKITTTGGITEYPLAAGSELHGIALGPDGNMWVPEYTNSKIVKITLKPAEGESRPPQQGSTIEYDVPLEGSNVPAQMGVDSETHKPEPEKWNQQEEEDPVEATAIFPPDSPQGWPASSYTRATTYYLDEHGREVNVARPSKSSYGAVSTTEYNEENDVTRTLSPENRITSLEAGSQSAEVSKLLDTEYTYNSPECRKETPEREVEVAEYGTRLCETWGPEHEVKYTPNGYKEAHEAMARDHTEYVYEDLAKGAPEVEKGEKTSSTKAYDLVTDTTNIAKLENGSKEEVESRESTTSYSGQEGLGWKLRAPTSVTNASEPEGLKVTHTTLYNKETGQITETRGPNGASGESAHDSKIVYYTPENEAEVSGCHKHPEWAGLVCETLPAKQPETSKLPKLPVTETTYNMWNEPETVTETFPAFEKFAATTRTKKEAYDPAGRLTSSETTATGSTDASLPKVSYVYEPKQGMVEKESTTIGGKPETISSVYNTLGQIESYTDADGNTAQYKYYGTEDDNQIEEVSDGSDAGKSKQTYSYEETTRLLTTLKDSAAETFTASYNAEGKMTSETYPNAMCANYTYNSVGEATGLEYVKTTNCSESKPPMWFSETRVPSVNGATTSRTSTLAHENYSYDTLSRLTEVQETPAGGGCSVRLYAYDEESNRTSYTARKPGSKEECAASGGTEEKHTYDEANRMTDTGTEYENLGNVTKLPAADAEGHELASTFYIDGAVASQSQNGVTNEYQLDSSGRVHDTTTGGKETISHYDGAGEAVAWTCELVAGKCESTSKWTRNIPGIDGTLAAVQTNDGTPVLQLHDLEGNIVATAELNPAATKLLSTYNSTEFGAPNAEKAPPTFGWLGASDVSKSLSSGVITYGATSYVPQTGLTLQTQQVEAPGYPVAVGGGAPATFIAEPEIMQGAAREGAEAPGLEAGRAEEAAVAALKACESGGGGACDPPKTLYFDAAEVAVMCGVINALDVASVPIEAIELVTMKLSDLAEKLLIDVAKETIGIHSPTEWAESIETDLNACLGLMTSGYKGQNLNYVRCAIATPFSEVALPVLGEIATIPDLFGMPSASYCLYYSGHCGAYNSKEKFFIFSSGKTLT